MSFIKKSIFGTFRDPWLLERQGRQDKEEQMCKREMEAKL